MTPSQLQSLRSSGVWPEKLEQTDRGTFFYREASEGIRWPIPDSFARSALIERMLEELPEDWTIDKYRTDEIEWSVISNHGKSVSSSPDLFTTLYLALASSGRVKTKENA